MRAAPFSTIRRARQRSWPRQRGARRAASIRSGALRRCSRRRSLLLACLALVGHCLRRGLATERPRYLLPVMAVAHRDPTSASSGARPGHGRAYPRAAVLALILALNVTGYVVAPERRRGPRPDRATAASLAGRRRTGGILHRATPTSFPGRAPHDVHARASASPLSSLARLGPTPGLRTRGADGALPRAEGPRCVRAASGRRPRAVRGRL